jgi:hypothetical protein
VGIVAHPTTPATLDAVAPPGRVFELLIAASIDVVGVESLVRRREPGRTRGPAARAAPNCLKGARGSL